MLIELRFIVHTPNTIHLNHTELWECSGLIEHKNTSIYTKTMCGHQVLAAVIFLWFFVFFLYRKKKSFNASFAPIPLQNQLQLRTRERVHIYTGTLCKGYTHTHVCGFFLFLNKIVINVKSQLVPDYIQQFVLKNTLSVQDFPAFIYICYNFYSYLQNFISSMHHILGWRQLESGKLKSVHLTDMLKAIHSLYSSNAKKPTLPKHINYTRLESGLQNIKWTCTLGILRCLKC